MAFERIEHVTIIPGWTLRPENNWYQPAAQYIHDVTGADVQVVGLPNPDNPDPEECIEMMHDTIVEPEKHLVIPHSLAFIVAVNWIAREVETDPTFRLAAIEPVAANIHAVGFAEINQHFDCPDTEDAIDDNGFLIPDEERTRKVMEFGRKMMLVRSALQYRPTVIHGAHDQFVPFEHAQVIRKLLEAEMIVDESQAHFSGMYAPEDGEVIPATQDTRMGEAIIPPLQRQRLYATMPWYAIGKTAAELIRISRGLHIADEIEAAARTAPENTGDPVLDSINRIILTMAELDR